MANDRTKLPMWAQDQLRLLEGNLASVTAERDVLLGNAPSRITLDSWGQRPSIGIPESGRVMFQLTEPMWNEQPERISATIESEGGHDWLTLASISGGTSRLIIQPKADNRILVRTSARDDLAHWQATRG